MIIAIGQTDVISYFKLVDAVTGLPITGLTIADLDATYVRDQSTAVKNDLTELGSVTTAHTDNTAIEIDATNTPGLYRVDFPDAAFITGVNRVQLCINGEVIDPAYIEIELSPDVNIAEISGDSTAADNLESQYDLTGLSGGTFPAFQSQVSGTASGSSSISTVADSGTANTGTPTNTYESTHALDGVYWSIVPDGGALQATITFNVGTTGVPSSITLDGRLFDAPGGTSDILDVEAYNYVSDQYEGIGIITGINSGTDQVHTFTLINQHVDDDTVPGEVSIRFTNQAGFTGTTTLYIDRILCSYAVVASAVGYDGGQIWIDTENGSPGDVKDVNGVADNPVDNPTDALSLSGLTNLREFHLAIGSTLTLIGDSSGMLARGALWNLNLAEQVITSASVTGANVAGIAGTGSSGSEFNDCSFGTCTLTPFTADHSVLTETMTLLTTGVTPTYTLAECFSGIAGTATPAISFGVAGTAKALNMRDYSGGIEIQDMQAGDTMSLEGHGQIVINANCAGGTIATRGHFKKSGDATAIAAITWHEDANFFDTKGMLADIETDIGNLNDIAATDIVSDGPIETVTGAVREVNTILGNVKGDVEGSLQGNVEGNVGSVVTDVTLGNDEITANTLAASAITEIQNGLAIKTTQDTIAIDVAGLDGEVMRGTNGANTVVPMDDATSQAEHGATQSELANVIEPQLDNISGDVSDISAIQQADKTLDVAAGTLTYQIKGTSTAILKKNLKDQAGNAVNSTEDIIATEVDTTP